MSDLSRKRGHERADQALQYVMKIYGFNSVETMERNIKMFDGVSEMLMQTKLTNSEVEMERLVVNKSVVNYEVRKLIEKEVQKLEAQLVSTLPRK
eukprot:6313959-Ditylum_brightwellii.AAC.1